MSLYFPFRHPSVKSESGFTLIELAVVIAIIAILAAVAVPRFTGVTGTAERSMIIDLSARLADAAAMYTAEQSGAPLGFNDYVQQTGAVAKPKTMTLSTFGTSAGTCTVSASVIDCSNTFKNYTGVKYNWASGGVITYEATPVNGAPEL